MPAEKVFGWRVWNWLSFCRILEEALQDICTPVHLEAVQCHAVRICDRCVAGSVFAKSLSTSTAGGWRTTTMAMSNLTLSRGVTFAEIAATNSLSASTYQVAKQRAVGRIRNMSNSLFPHALVQDVSTTGKWLCPLCPSSRHAKAIAVDNVAVSHASQDCNSPPSRSSSRGCHVVDID
jgi:hypothetical protein